MCITIQYNTIQYTYTVYIHTVDTSTSLIFGAASDIQSPMDTQLGARSFPSTKLMRRKKGQSLRDGLWRAWQVEAILAYGDFHKWGYPKMDGL